MGYGSIFQWKKKRDIGIVTFDVPGEAMNTWTEEAVNEFSALLDELEKATDIKGMILISGKPGNFHAGANLNFLNKMKDKAGTAKVLGLFHCAFKRLNGLIFPTVAAIEGHCLGGGLEFALACTARIAKGSKNTLLGLPECTLGVLPGGGGTARLPRLIGYDAIDLILKGKVLPAAKAYDLGIVDRLIPEGGIF